MNARILKSGVRSFLFFLTTGSFYFLLVTTVFSMEPEGKWDEATRGVPNEIPAGDMIRKVVHEEKPQKVPMPVDGPSSGICPQERNTPHAPEHFLKMTNPLEPTPENLRAGEALFKIDARPTACKVCHGYGGDGMGVIFEQLTPKPRNFTCYYTMDDIPDGQMYWIIKNGSPGTKMPSFGSLSDKEVWQLVLFIRQFSKNTK